MGIVIGKVYVVLADLREQRLHVLGAGPEHGEHASLTRFGHQLAPPVDQSCPRREVEAACGEQRRVLPETVPDEEVGPWAVLGGGERGQCPDDEQCGLRVARAGR